MITLHQSGTLRVVCNFDTKQHELLDGTTVIFASKPLLPVEAAFVAAGGVLTVKASVGRKRDRQEAAERGNHGGWGISRSGRR